VRALTLTREHEIDCGECLDKVAEFAERELAGKPVPDALESVRHHLTRCGECREEYEALLTALVHLQEQEGR
jgi:bacterioferritin-associated ferredoxin